ncbi:MAG TPA: hypothetical protein VMX55_14040 [candidate division Zixibacteria bacterium]|nr:hypothetical protein [candidate division Zixibacteria bacterium]
MYFNDPTNYAYILGGVIALIVSLLIFSKDPKKILNILFGGSLFLWSISLLCNALTFLFVNPDEKAVEIIRDYTTSAGVISATLIFAAAYSMYKGTHFLKKWYFFFPVCIITIVSVIIVILFDHVVWDNETGEGVKTTQESWVLIFLYVIPAIMIIFAEYYFIKTRMEVSDKLVRKRILYFILGFVFIFCGVLVYILFSILEQTVGIKHSIVEYSSWIIASIFWALGPILMLIGFYQGKIHKKEKYKQDESIAL